MGQFNQHITVSGPESRKRLARIRRKAHDTSPEDMRYVYVNDWPAAPAGVRSCVIRSSNRKVPRTDFDSWRHGVQELVDRRLQRWDGESKGRVIYLIANDWMRGEEVIGVLGFHLDGEKLDIGLLEVDPALQTRRRGAIVTLLGCAEKIAREAGGGTAKLQWDIARGYETNDDFKVAEPLFTKQTDLRDGMRYVRNA